VPDLIRGVSELAEKYRLNIVCFGHAGDGNIHVNIMVDKKNTEVMMRAHRAVDEVFQLTLRLEGSISGEHGIGITKAPYMMWESGPLAIEAMQRIKRVFDPLNILNPGKMFHTSAAGEAHSVETA